MWIVADLTFDTDAEAQEAERLAREGKLAGVSVDLADVSEEVEILAVDDEGFPSDWLVTVTDAEIIAATQVAMPAFGDARIESTPTGYVAYLAPEGLRTSDRRLIGSGALRWRDPAPLMFNDTSDGHDGATFVGNLTNFRRESGLSLVASGSPQLPALTKPRIENGELVGHGAGWGTCHVGFSNACITPPSSTYQRVKDGAKVYKHPRGDVHAPLSLGVEEAMRWYDTHCELVGVVDVGEDEHGIWVKGPTLLEEEELFLSGDWRADPDDLELVSFLVVDNPGFPTALVASDHQQALVAAGIVTESDDVVTRLEKLERIVENYRAEKQAQILEQAFL